MISSFPVMFLLPEGPLSIQILLGNVNSAYIFREFVFVLIIKEKNQVGPWLG